MNRLKGCITPISELSDCETVAMWRLMQRFYKHVSWSVFMRDLAEKDSVIILRDACTSDIKGFSTLMVIQTEVEGVQIAAVFSGDTIIDKEYWGEQVLSKLMIQYQLQVLERFSNRYVCWFLISKGYKTYRALPLYFRKFYPCHNEDTPVFEQAVINNLSRLKFGDSYDEARGLIVFNEPSECLRPDVAMIDDKLLKNPHIRHFVLKNPGHREGDELACVARIAPDNFNRAFLRMVRQE